LKAPMIRHSSG